MAPRRLPIHMPACRSRRSRALARQYRTSRRHFRRAIIAAASILTGVTTSPSSQAPIASVAEISRSVRFNMLAAVGGQPEWSGHTKEDLRKRVIAAVEEDGLSQREAARRYRVSESSAVKWLGAFHGSGRTGPRPMGGDRRSVLKPERACSMDRSMASNSVLASSRHGCPARSRRRRYYR